MGSIVLPPSPNWFHHNTVSCNEREKLYATASFRNIVVYRIIKSKDVYIEPQKAISFNNGKVKGLSIYPYMSSTYSRTLAAFGDLGGLLIINCDTGSYIAEQKCKDVFNSLCWAVIDDDDCIVAVGNSGLISIWTPGDMSQKNMHLENRKNLSLIEPIPFNKSEALVVCENQIVQINLKTCEPIKYFRGHQNDIYCISWCDTVENPFEVDLDFCRKTNVYDECNGINNEHDESDERAKLFATTDFNKNILIWDFVLGKYKLALEQAGKPTKIKEKSKVSYHISLLWLDNRLYSSSITGDILVWNLRDKDASSRPLCNIHNRVIYNMSKFDHTIITYAQDRQICGFDVNSKKLVFQMPTIGICPRTMCFNPHDPSRLAMGFQDGSMKLVNFQMENNVKTHYACPTIKNVILALSWHPVEETRLLYGASDGQVGIIDVQAKKFRVFSVFHKNDVYRVEWGPPLNREKYGIQDEWCVYSLGGNNIFMRSSTDLVKDPVDVIKALPCSCLNPKPTDFAFTPDYAMLAIGYNEGQISIYNMKTRTLTVKIETVRKIIQHLNWKPFKSSEPNYVLGVASGEIIVYVFDVSLVLKSVSQDQESITVLQATKEFLGHRSRIAWLSWSPHNDELLASASYDHTVQVWNSKTGQPVCCYGSHPNRLFRVEFSPTEKNVLFSFSEENCVHKWCTKDIKTLLTKDAIAENKRRAKSNAFAETDPEESEGKCESEDSPPQLRNTKMVPAARCSSHFPTFHGVSKRKRSFHHICILVLRKELQMKMAFSPPECADEVEHHTEIFPDIDRKKILDEILADYKDLLPNESITVEDVSTFLDLFGDAGEAAEALNRELAQHRSKGNVDYCHEMNLWNGTLETHLRLCAKNNKLTPFLVSVAPSVSRSLWEFACESYSIQLVTQGEIILASSYLQCLHKNEEAVRLLTNRHHYREAMCVVRSKLSFNTELIIEVTESWAQTAIREGNFELATVLYMSVGKLENAARTMSRRTELWSLFLGRELYELDGNIAMAKAIGAMAFREAIRRNKLSTFKTFLDSCPGLQWLKPLYVTANFFIESVNAVEVPSVHNFWKLRKTGEPILIAIKALWIENDLDFDCDLISLYLKHFPLDITHIPAQDSKQMMLLWLFISISMVIAVISGDGRDSDQHAWDDAIHYILETAITCNNEMVLYKILSLIFRNDSEILTIDEMMRCLLHKYSNENLENTDDIKGISSEDEAYKPFVNYLITVRCFHTLSGLNCLHSSIKSSADAFDKEELKSYIQMQCDIFQTCKETLGPRAKTCICRNVTTDDESTSCSSSVVETAASMPPLVPHIPDSPPGDDSCRIGPNADAIESVSTAGDSVASEAGSRNGNADVKESLTGDKMWKEHHFNEEWNKLAETGLEIRNILYGIVDAK